MRRAEPLGVGGGDLQMFGRNGVDQRQRLVEIAHQDHRAEIAPRGAATLSRGNCASCAVDRAFGRVGQRRVVGDEDRLRAGIVLGLRQKIGGDPIRIAVLVGDDQHLGRPGDHVDADFAEHQALGGGHIGVAGPDDLGDRRNRLACHRPKPRSPARRRCERSRRRRRVSPPQARAD